MAKRRCSKAKLNNSFRIPIQELEERIGCKLNGYLGGHNVIVPPTQIDVKQSMDETILESTQLKDNTHIGLHLLKFAGRYELTRIADNPGDFTEFLSSKY